MNPDRWQKVKIILEDVLEIPSVSRNDFLEKACGGDEDLRREVENLLDFENSDSDPLEGEAVAAVLENGSRQNGKNLIGRQIGNYEIIEPIGAGGMGAVYLAERSDGTFEQKAALKLIKRGMDSDEVLRRFVNERQILASLKHPNIAHLIDGGTSDDGLPFFVLEYVEGATILEYAARENLGLEERLNLFREICAAVSFAHQNLVIHRDLKPSNILITKDGNVKLLDFGIAKLLNSDTENLTATQMQVFTPEYASPEQVRGENLTTATDVYSLGVVLYELLTGTRPYQTASKNISDMIKAVCETEPIRPSSVVSIEQSTIGEETNRNKGQTTNPKSKIQNLKLLKGDLDSIILKSLRKETDRRYSSVEQFSEDISRYLDGLPVSASVDSWTYYTGKFIKRNRTAVIFAALLLVALSAGIVGTTWQAVRAERLRITAESEREKAEQRSKNLRKISNSLVGEIERAIRDLPGSLPARQILLARAVEQLDALALESNGDADLQLELVWAYQNLAALPDKKLSESDAIFRKALSLTEKILADGTAGIKARDRLAMLYLDIINNSRARGDAEFTLEYNTKAVSIVEQILRDGSAEAEYQDSFWTANYHYVLTMQQLGRARDIIETGRKILPVAEQLYRTNPPDTDKYNFMKPQLTRLAIGYGLNYAGDYQEAIAELQTAIDECRAEQIKRPDEQILRRNEANMLLLSAIVLENSGMNQKGLEQVYKSLAIREKIAAENPDDFNYQTFVADGEIVAGQMLTRIEQPLKAINYFRRALASYERAVSKDGERMQAKITAARIRAVLGHVLVLNGNMSEGLMLLREAVKFYELINAGNSIDANLQSHYAETLKCLADVLSKGTKNQSKARELYRRSLDLWKNMQRTETLRKSDEPKIAEISRRIYNSES